MLRKRSTILSTVFQGGFGQGPWLESHGGSTLRGCRAIFVGRLERLPSRKNERFGALVQPANTQDSRVDQTNQRTLATHHLGWVEPIEDRWVCRDCIDWKRLKTLFHNSGFISGLSKWPDNYPDPHTYLGLSGLC